MELSKNKHMKRVKRHGRVFTNLKFAAILCAYRQRYRKKGKNIFVHSVYFSNSIMTIGQVFVLIVRETDRQTHRRNAERFT